MSEVEKVARILHKQDPIASDFAWEQIGDADRSEFLRNAAEIIAAIDEARGHELRGALLSQMALVAAPGGEVCVSQDDIANLFRVQLEKLDDLTTGGYIFRLRPLPAPPQEGA